MARPPKSYKGHAIKWAKCCKRWVVRVATADEDLIWVYLDTWDKGPIFVWGLHKEHPPSCGRWYPARSVKKDSDFTL